MLSLDDLSEVLIVFVSSVSDWHRLGAERLRGGVEGLPDARDRPAGPAEDVVDVADQGDGAGLERELVGVLGVEGGVDEGADGRVGDQPGLHAEVDCRDDEVLRVEHHPERGRRVELRRGQDAGPLDLGRAVRTPG